MFPGHLLFSPVAKKKEEEKKKKEEELDGNNQNPGSQF